MVENSSQPSPASHSGRLKYADPRDLPSYPSHGLRPDGAAASAAASLGWATQKPIAIWKPDETSSASAAAVLAKDYKASPTWEPAADSAGAKAALLAVGSADAALKHASSKNSKGPHDGWGNSAATQAFRAPRPSSTRDTNSSHGNTAAAQAFATSRKIPVAQSNVASKSREDRSLAAAKGAMALSRPRATSSPSSPMRNDPPTATSNALNGAALAHRASLKPKPVAENAGAVSVTTMTRNMFTSNPPVKPEVDEMSNNEKLHQSAVAMARKMYQQQQKTADQAQSKHDSVNNSGPAPYVNLQEAAYKQAQERLAKLHDEHQKSRDYQEYYGSSQAPRRRFSMAAKLRRRSSSEGDMDDQERSQKIRQEMSMFSNKLSGIDKNKRDKDREALLAAAQRNVKARLQGMDEKVYHETGMINPSMLSDWEIKAQQTAQTRHEGRTVNKGKVDIGGGKFMDPEDVDAIAAKRVQPVLDDINEKAEAERERLTALRLDEEAKRADQEKQKTREREVKDINKKLKDQEKQEERGRRQQEKQDEKTRKDEEKVARTEHKRQAKEEKRRPRHEPAAKNAAEEELTRDIDNASGDRVEEQRLHNKETREGGVQPTIETGTANDWAQQKSGDSPTSPTSKVKGWIRNRFSRSKSISEQGEKKKGFLGGASLRDSEANASAISLENRPSSMRDVAMAGLGEDTEPRAPALALDSRGVSPVSGDEDDDEEPRRPGSAKRDKLSMNPPRPIEDQATRTSSSPTRDSRFREEMDR